MNTLKIGQKAPNFTFQTVEGQSKKLSDLAGKKIVLYFYPKDDTPGCTVQACNLRDDYSHLLEAGIEVIGISADSDEKHEKFRAKYGLPFPLVADTDKEVIQAYGAWGQKKFMGKEYEGILRTTFIIDEKGMIEHVIEKVKTKEHSNQINELLNFK
ncbi:MAG: thioredoxin-dependent thiol peroxidase [Cryomorphaceae bacterium]|nr:MAG: thioredoxin-dependent thiol peroxidase [Cryomorphaceae bacterium]